MTETSYVWGGTATGDATLAPYSDDEWANIWNTFFGSVQKRSGVIRDNSAGTTVLDDYDVDLAVDSTIGTTTVTVRPGRAIINGRVYMNDANIDFTCSGANVYWLYVIQVVEATQTARAVQKGSYASLNAAYAGLVWTASTQYEIALAIVKTDGSGNSEYIYDLRNFILSKRNTQTQIAVAGYNFDSTAALTRADAASRAGGAGTMGNGASIYTMPANDDSIVWSTWTIPGNAITEVRFYDFINIPSDGAVQFVCAASAFAYLFDDDLTLTAPSGKGGWYALALAGGSQYFTYSNTVIAQNNLITSGQAYFRPHMLTIPLYTSGGAKGQKPGDTIHYSFGRLGNHASDNSTQALLHYGTIMEYESI